MLLWSNLKYVQEEIHLVKVPWPSALQKGNVFMSGFYTTFSLWAAGRTYCIVWSYFKPKHLKKHKLRCSDGKPIAAKFTYKLYMKLSLNMNISEWYSCAMLDFFTENQAIISAHPGRLVTSKPAHNSVWDFFSFFTNSLSPPLSSAIPKIPIYKFLVEYITETLSGCE